MFSYKDADIFKSPELVVRAVCLTKVERSEKFWKLGAVYIQSRFSKHFKCNVEEVNACAFVSEIITLNLEKGLQVTTFSTETWSNIQLIGAELIVDNSAKNVFEHNVDAALQCGYERSDVLLTMPVAYKQLSFDDLCKTLLKTFFPCKGVGDYTMHDLVRLLKQQRDEALSAQTEKLHENIPLWGAW